MPIFRLFENLLEPTAPPSDAAPPSSLGAFYWHHARQVRRLIVALFAAGSVVAVLDTTIPVFFGRVVTLLSRHTTLSRWAEVWPQLLGMALVLLVARPMAMLLQNLITNQAIIPGFSNLIRWQNHWHVVRQSWSFFQNDFAGRIANRVMQTGPALRESVVAATNAVWYILVYGGGAIALLASNDVRLAVPVCCGLPATRQCCACSCRGCATARRACRRRARRSSAGSSTATPIFRPSSCSPGRATRMPLSARRSTI
jgi:ATP-binding cassette subfamily B multidrug efflux pump